MKRGWKILFPEHYFVPILAYYPPYDGDVRFWWLQPPGTIVESKNSPMDKKTFQATFER